MIPLPLLIFVQDTTKCLYRPPGYFALSSSRFIRGFFAHLLLPILSKRSVCSNVFKYTLSTLTFLTYFSFLSSRVYTVKGRKTMSSDLLLMRSYNKLPSLNSLRKVFLIESLLSLKYICSYLSEMLFLLYIMQGTPGLQTYWPAQ
jgi:hypothetical protein